MAPIKHLQIDKSLYNGNDFHLLRPLWLESVMFVWRSAITWGDDVCMMRQNGKEKNTNTNMKSPWPQISNVEMLLRRHSIYAFWSNFIKRNKHVHTLTNWLYKYVCKSSIGGDGSDDGDSSSSNSKKSKNGTLQWIICFFSLCFAFIQALGPNCFIFLLYFVFFFLFSRISAHNLCVFVCTMTGT